MKKALMIICIFYSTAKVVKSGNICTGDSTLKNNRRIVNIEEMQSTPFGAIAQLYRTKVCTKVLGTVSFVNDSFLLGSAHYIHAKKLINKIKLKRRNETGKEIEITFKRGEFEIIPNLNHNVSRFDFTVIKVKDISKLQEFFKGSFNIATYNSLASLAIDSVHLTGYPFDYKGLLIEKASKFSSLKIGSDEEIIGYPMFSCSGDSGAPLWVNFNDKYYLIGVHHGGNENNLDFTPLQYNVASVISDTSLGWILKQ